MSSREAREAAPPAPTEWRWFFRELRPHAGVQVMGVTALLASTVLSLADPLIIKWLVDAGLQQRRWSVVLWAVGLLCGVFLLRLVLLHVGTLSSAQVLQRVVLSLRLRLLRKLQGLDAAFYDRHRPGDLVHRLEQDAEVFGQVAADVLPGLVRILLGLAVTLAIMVGLDWRLSLVVLPFVPALLWLRAHFRKRLEAAAETTRSATGLRTSFLSESLHANLQVQLLGAERFFLRRYAGLAVGTTRANLAQRSTELVYLAASLTVVVLATAAVLLAGAYEFMHGFLTLGGYVAFYSYLMRLLDPLGSAVETHARLKRAGSSIRRLAEIERFEPSVRDRADARAVDPAAVREVDFRGVEFGYGPGGPLLRGVDLRLRRGDRVALVGQSGSGKSSLARLMVRLYDPAAGAVHLDGADLRGLRLRGVRDAASYVPQAPVLFPGTLRENVLLGVRATDEALDRLARVACFDSVLAKFPGRWDHVLGTGGSGLSDGERQRLGLLRALVRDRPFLVLDESTGALDPATEAEVMDRLDAHTRGKGVLLITHRPAAARWADRIAVLRDGRLDDAAPPGEAAVPAEHAVPVGQGDGPGHALRTPALVS